MKEKIQLEGKLLTAGKEATVAQENKGKLEVLYNEHNDQIKKLKK